MLRNSGLGIAALLTALVCLAAPNDARAQWAESFGLHCPGQWVSGGSLCLCPNGQYANYINGQVTCPGGGGASAPQGDPCGWGSCNPGSYCGEPGVCVPNGQTYCGGGQSCPAGTKCATGGCLPQEATDCGDGAYCPGGTLCWQDPPDDSGFYTGETQCLGVEEYADRTESLRREREENSPEAKARRAAAREREAAERKEIDREKRRAAAEERELDSDRKAQKERLLSSKSDPKKGPSNKSAAEIMRELREDSILDRLEAAGPGQPGKPLPNPRTAAPPPETPQSAPRTATVQGGFPSRQTPAPPAVEPAGRETRRLTDSASAPAPSPPMATAPQEYVSGDGPSWVQDFAVTGHTDPAKMPPAARAAYDERRREEAEAAARAARAQELEEDRAYYEQYRWDGGSNDRVKREILERQRREAEAAARARARAETTEENRGATPDDDCTIKSALGCDDVVRENTDWQDIE